MYQKTLSPDHSWLQSFFRYGYCQFHPTCSDYTKQAVDRFGVIRGCCLGGKRIIRCNPLSDGGIDEVPKK